MKLDELGGRRWLAQGAFFATAAFPVIVVALNLLQGRKYHPLSQPMSQLVLGRGGWLMTANFLVAASGLALLAVFLRRAVPGARAAPILLGVSSVLTVVDAIFPTDPPGALSVHGLIHNFAGLGIFVIGVAVMVVAGRRFRTVTSWQSFSRPTLVWAGCAAVALVGMFVLGGAGLFGLGQRISEAARISWLLALAWRGSTLTRTHSLDQRAVRV